MCDPVIGMQLALAGAQSGLSIMGRRAEIEAQNKHAAATGRLAKSAMNDEMASTTAGFIEQNRSLIQGGFDAVLAGRAAESTAYASAIENGVKGASVKATLRSLKQNTERSTGRTKQEIKSLSDQHGMNLKHVVSKAKGRMAGAPTTEWGIGDTAQALAPIVRSFQD